MASSRPIQSVSTLDLYNRWAEVYDTDGNILQAIDDHELPSILTQAFTTLSSDNPASSPITITELGCGTGRNTLKLLSSTPLKIINALDLSPSMLAIASHRTKSLLTTLPKFPQSLLNFHQFNAFSPPPPLLQELEGTADLVLSTLVLEHLPLPLFFQTCKDFLRPGGLLVMSNMHAEMGRKSQAGFMDEEEGMKVQGESFNYEVEEVLRVAREEGFGILGEMKERGVEEGDLGGVVGERGRKWIGVRVWFGGIFRLGG